MNSSPPNRATVSPVGERGQQPISGGVSERVVDRLEVVDVEEQDRHDRPVALGPVQRHPEPIEEEAPVRQTSERIVEGLMGEAALEPLALHRVRDGAAQPGRGQLPPDQVILCSGGEQPRDGPLVELIGDDDHWGIRGSHRQLLDRREALVGRRCQQHARRPVVQQLLDRVRQVLGFEQDHSLRPGDSDQLGEQQPAAVILVDQQHPRAYRSRVLFVHWPQGGPREKPHKSFVAPLLSS
jgi:hypothetical protein